MLLLAAERIGTVYGADMSDIQNWIDPFDLQCGELDEMLDIAEQEQA
jgi:hypothetical protein